MNYMARVLISSAISMAFLNAAVFAQNADDPESESQQDDTEQAASENPLEEVLVVSQRAHRTSTGATNLDLAIKETPQSISVLTQEQIAQFNANSVNDALRLATGVQVEQTSANLTRYTARGFEIKNTQIDGVGLPNGWGVVTNAIDSFGFERLEVIRGANGLLTGVGNASGTINYVRKRPTNETQGQLGLIFGSHSNYRIEADYSTPFTESGTWAGRVVAARQDSDSYLRDFESDRTFLYGVVDGQIGENGTLAFGYAWQESNTTGSMWGALTFSANDGSQLEWDRSASTTQDWTYWNATTNAGFIDYTHRLGDSWQLKASYNYRTYEYDSQLFLAYSISGLDPVTGTGLLGWAYKSPYETNAHLGDIKLNGNFELFGREQEAMFGVSSAKSDGTDWYNPTDFSGPAFGFLPGFPYAGDAIPEPTWGPRTVYTRLDQELHRIFGVTRLSLTDRFNAIIGFNWAEYHREGTDAGGVAFDQTENDTSPYVGLTFDITDTILAYANYSYIFQPQEQIDADENYLDPSKGVNYELGVKAEWFDQRLLTTLAWFSAEQEGLATFAGFIFLPDRAYGYYTGVDIESQGIEFEATGKINDYVDLLFGYTHLEMDGPNGSDTYSWVPRSTANLMLSAHLPSYEALSFGVSARWQSKISNNDIYSGYPVRQGSYATFNAFAAWDIRSDLTLRANIANITDEKYINSLYTVSYYGPPREYYVNLAWRF